MIEIKHINKIEHVSIKLYDNTKLWLTLNKTRKYFVFVFDNLIHPQKDFPKLFQQACSIKQRVRLTPLY